MAHSDRVDRDRKDSSRGKSSSQAAIERLASENPSEAFESEAALPEDNPRNGDSLPARGAYFQNFREELQYNGYKDIEEYDNDEYNANIEKENNDRAQELVIKDRPEDESIAAEENVLDKQENRKNEDL